MITFIRRNTSALIILNCSLLLSVGTIFLYDISRATHFVSIERHLFALVIGICLALLLYFININFLASYYWLALVLVFFVLCYLAVYTLFSLKLPYVLVINGGVRWLKIFGYSIQPSEFARLAIIIFCSYYFGYFSARRANVWYYFCIPTFLVGITLVAILLGKSLSMFVIGLVLFASFFYISGLNRRLFKLLFVVAIVLCMIGIVFFSLNPKKLERLEYWFYERDVNYQAKQAKLAIHSSGFFGNDGDFYRKVPLYFSDFSLVSLIYSWGLLGLIFVGGLFFSLLFLSFVVFTDTHSMSYKLMTFGIGANLVFPFVFQLAVVCGLLPVTGLVVPFFSHGGSNAIVSVASLGLLLRISRKKL